MPQGLVSHSYAYRQHRLDSVGYRKKEEDMKLDVVVVVQGDLEGVDVIKILGGPSTLFWVPKAPAISFLHTHTNMALKKLSAANMDSLSGLLPPLEDTV